MNNLFFYQIQMVPVLVHFLLLVWLHLFPTRKIPNTAKGSATRWCYCSELAASNARMWQRGQKIFCKWNRLLFIPNLISSLLIVTAFIKLLHPVELDVMALVMMICCIFVPILFMYQARVLTEKELRLITNSKEVIYGNEGE